MSGSFYFRRDNDIRGPVTTRQLRQMAADGTLRRNDYVRADAQDKWHVAAGVKGLFPETQEDLPRGRAEAATLATEDVIDVEGFERDRKRRRAARRKITVPLAIAGGLSVIVLVVAVLSGRRQTKPYTLLRDEVTSDTRIRGQIEIDLLIDAPMSKDDILEVLRAKFNEAIRRRVFRQRGHANCVVVSAFSSIEHYQAESSYHRLAWMMQVPADDTPRIEFNDLLHKQLSERPETKHGLSESARRQIYRDYCRANYRASEEADKEYPTDPDLLLKVGDVLCLVEPLMLMGQNNAEEWFAKGCPSMEVPAGTEIKVIQTVKNDQGTKYTQVAAYPPNERNGYEGWVVTYALGAQHPTIRALWAREAASSDDKERYHRYMMQRNARAEELIEANSRAVLKMYAISDEVMASIYAEGSQKQWPY